MMYKGLIARLYRRVLHKYFVNDLYFELHRIARDEAVAYIREHMRGAMMFRDRDEQLLWALRETKVEGLILEFGVEKGASVNLLAGATDRTVHGFDSFEGIPDDWTGTRETRGKFTMKGRLPKVRSNVKLHVGWFDDTLPRFLAQTDEPAAFVHVDCDIYSSTRTVFELLTPRIQSGTIIVFDEYFNYPAWREHEHKAFHEWIAATGRRFEYIGFTTEKGHVAARIL